MPITPTYPGVYIEEIPSGVRTITGVATSVAAFIDYFKKGSVNKAVQIFNMGDFDREFGGLDSKSEASYGIWQFFLNGGTEAWVVRVVSNAAAKATVQIDNNVAGAVTALTVTAISEGTWGNNLRVKVDSNTPGVGEFNLTISEYATLSASIPLGQEVFRNLSMNSSLTNFVQKVVNDPYTGSKLVQVTATGNDAPLANGTLSGSHGSNPTIPASPEITVTIANGTTTLPTPTVAVPLAIAAGAQPLTAIAPVLEAAIRATAPAIPAFAGATVATQHRNTDRILRGEKAGGARPLGDLVRLLAAGPGT